MKEIVCPSGLTFRARKFGGRIFAQLAAKNDDIGTLGDIVEQCCVEITDPGPYAIGKDGKINWRRVLAGDLAVAFVGIRSISLPATHDGDTFTWTLKCSNLDCRDDDNKRFEYVWTVRVEDVPLEKLSAETRDLVKKGNVFRGKLLDDRGFTYKLPTDEDAPVIRRLLAESGIDRTKLTGDNVVEVLRPFLVAARVLSVEGCSSVAAAREEILDGDMTTILDVEKQIVDRDGGFGAFQAKCPSCGTERDLTLPTTPQLLLSSSTAALKSAAPTAKAKDPTSSVELGASSTPASPG